MNIGKQFLGQFSSIGVLTSILKITNWSKCQQLYAVFGLVPLMNRWKLQVESCQHIRKGIVNSIENKHTDARVWGVKAFSFLGVNQVLPGVGELVEEVQVEGTFPDGTKLVSD